MTDKEKIDQFFIAIRDGNIEEMISALESGVDPNNTSHYGYGYLCGMSALHILADKSENEWEQAFLLAEKLLEYKPNINIKYLPYLSESSGCTPLHWAIIYANTNLSRLYLQYGADPTIQNRLGQTPLHNLAFCNSDISEKDIKEMVDILFDHGADSRITDNNGDTALDIANKIKLRNQHVIELLQNHIELSSII